MREIKKDGVLYATHDSRKSIPYHTANIYKEGSTWYGNDAQPLQASRMVYNGGKEFDTHRHKINPRNITHTQEAMICVDGIAEIKVYDMRKNYLETITLEKGDIGIFYNGYHGLKILCNNTVLYEIKCGQFTSVEKDKEYYEK